MFTISQQILEPLLLFKLFHQYFDEAPIIDDDLLTPAFNAQATLVKLNLCEVKVFVQMPSRQYFASYFEIFITF